VLRYRDEAAIRDREICGLRAWRRWLGKEPNGQDHASKHKPCLGERKPGGHGQMAGEIQTEIRAESFARRVRNRLTVSTQTSVIKVSPLLACRIP
jgi:hypothetical protein